MEISKLSEKILEIISPNEAKATLAQKESTATSKALVGLSLMVSEDESIIKREHICHDLGKDQVADAHQLKRE